MRSRSAGSRAAARRFGFAALTAAVLVGFELVLTHWFYLYLPWFFPFVALALIAPLPGAEEPAQPPVEDERADADALAAV